MGDSPEKKYLSSIFYPSQTLPVLGGTPQKRDNLQVQFRETGRIKNFLMFSNRNKSL